MESSECEELTLCGSCRQKFNDTDQSPKMLSCKHYFCLQCTRTSLAKGPGELYCVHCWKRTALGELGPEALPTYAPVLHLVKSFAQLKLGSSVKPPPPDKPPKVISENCHTHAMPLALWCHTCGVFLCRACASTSEHINHQVKSQNEAKDQLVAEVQMDLVAMNKILAEIQRLAMQQREFLVKILEACVTLKTHVEAELTNSSAHVELNETRDYLAKARMNLSVADGLGEVQNLCSQLNFEKQRLQSRYQEMYLQCQLDDLIRNSTMVLDFQLLKQAVASIQGEFPGNSHSHSRVLPLSQQNPILFLANYCLSQLYSRHISKQQPMNGDYHNHQSPYAHPPTQLLLTSPKPLYPDNNLIQVQNMIHSPQIIKNPPLCPMYYFNIEVNGAPIGRIVIEVRVDVAPKMAKNFGVLAAGDLGMGYKGCSIFQCWEGESVITGDFESNNGRGGRSIFEDSFFLPDDTKLLAVRGTVGMRRTQKRHDNLGMVGSQFRIILQEMRGFTGIFGHVVEGLELVEKLSTYGDNAGKPTKNILIVKCGKL